MALARFGAIGDIHCEHEALERVLEHFSTLDLDAVLAVGDIADGVGDVDRCCALLEAHGVIAVRGNHERWLLSGDLRTLPEATVEVTAQTRAYLASLPSVREVETVGGRLMLCHGVGEDDMVRLGPDTRGYGLQAALGELRERQDLRFVVCGHTHERMARAIGHLTFLNAGTLHRAWPQSALVADLEERTATFLELAPGGLREAERLGLGDDPG